MTKYYLTAFNPDSIAGRDYSPIGGLSDITGWSEFPDDLMEYINDSSFYFEGQVFFVKDNEIYIYADLQLEVDPHWKIFDEPIKLEEFQKVERLG